MDLIDHAQPNAAHDTVRRTSETRERVPFFGRRDDQISAIGLVLLLAVPNQLAHVDMEAAVVKLVLPVCDSLSCERLQRGDVHGGRAHLATTSLTRPKSSEAHLDHRGLPGPSRSRQHERPAAAICDVDALTLHGIKLAVWK
eukprot:scaffold12452_cov113-Isochrysis_galbana.AAC.10